MTSELKFEDVAFITRPLSQGLGAVGVGVCELDSTGRVEWLSHHAAKLFETSVDAAVGQDLAQLVAHAERSALPLRLVPQGPRLAFVVEDLDRDGVLAQLKLNHAAVEAAANSIVITDSDGLIQYVNPAFTLMTGYSKAEAVGQHTRLLRSGPQDKAFYEVLWGTLLSGATWHGTLINKRKDGSTYTEESTITPIMGGGARPTHFIAVKRDVSEQRRLEAAALRSERLGVVGELAVSVAHDLANVLAPVVSTVSFLKDEDTTALERAEAITDLEDGARRATAMMRQLVDFARGGIGLRTAIQTTRLTRTYAEQLRRAMPKRVTFEVLVRDDLPVLVADSLQLYQVLLNLCVNAADAMPTGGVVLGAAVVEREGVSFVEFSVRDTGTGIEPRALPHLFEPFYTTKEPGQGTGLGLPTVKRVAEAHGGFVTVQSTLGEGSTFSVCLPVGP